MTDEDLREHLRRADPAVSLTPIAPEAVPRLLEKAMTPTGIPARIDESAHRPKSRRLAMFAAAAVLAVMTVSSAILIVGGGRGSSRGTVAAPATTMPATTTTTTTPTTKGEQSITRLSVRSGDTGRCLPPSAAHLAASASLAFEGSVVRVDGNVATLKVKQVWTGARTDLVQVTQTDEDTAALLAGVVLKTGETYLVAAADGQVMVCGYSGLADPELRALYEAAF